MDLFVGLIRNLIDEGDRLFLLGHHRSDDLFLVQFDLVYSLEHFWEVSLNSFNVLRVSNYLQQVFVSNKVETREELSLVFQILLKRFLDLVELCGKLLKLLQQVLFRLDGFQSVFGLKGGLHQIKELLVYLEHSLVLALQLILNVFVLGKDGLQVDPLPLDLQPDLKRLGNQKDFFLPSVYLDLKDFETRGELHRVQLLEILFGLLYEKVPVFD